MHGFGEHVQLSVFRCDLTSLQHAVMKRTLDELVHHHEDQVLILDLGSSVAKTLAGIEVLGRPRAFQLPRARVI